jgi:predicted transposase YdaD
MSGQLELPHDVAGDKTLAPLYEAAQLALLPPEVRMNYIKKIMNRNDYGNILLGRYEDGMAVGMEKGVDKGIEMAVKKMAESGLDAGRIAEIMQISIEKVDQTLSAAEEHPVLREGEW